MNGGRQGCPLGAWGQPLKRGRATAIDNRMTASYRCCVAQSALGPDLVLWLLLNRALQRAKAEPMKVLVPVKRVVDYNVKVRVKADGSGVDIANVKMSMNPFDEIACEEAIRLREAGKATEIIAVSLGEAKSQETLAHRAGDGCRPCDPGRDLGRAAAVGRGQAFAGDRREAKQPGLVLMGKQAIDDDSNQTPQMLAALLGWPQATFVSKLQLEDGHASVSREVDEGLEQLKVKLPADHQRRSAPERAALRLTSQHHESQEEAGRHPQARGSGRRSCSPAEIPALCRTAQAAGRAPRSARSPSWWPSSRTRRECSDGGPDPGTARQCRHSTRRPCIRGHGGAGAAIGR